MIKGSSQSLLQRKMDSYQPAVSTKFQEQTTCGPVPKHIPMQWKISIGETISTKNKSLPWRHHVSQTGTRPQHTLQDLLPNILSSENKGSFLMHFPFCISLNFCREPCLRTQLHLPASKPGTAFMYSPGHPILPLHSRWHTHPVTSHTEVRTPLFSGLRAAFWLC